MYRNLKEQAVLTGDTNFSIKREKLIVGKDMAEILRIDEEIERETQKKRRRSSSEPEDVEIVETQNIPFERDIDAILTFIEKLIHGKISRKGKKKTIILDKDEQEKNYWPYFAESNAVYNGPILQMLASCMNSFQTIKSPITDFLNSLNEKKGRLITTMLDFYDDDEFEFNRFFSKLEPSLQNLFQMKAGTVPKNSTLMFEKGITSYATEKNDMNLYLYSLIFSPHFGTKQITLDLIEHVNGMQILTAPTILCIEIFQEIAFYLTLNSTILLNIKKNMDELYVPQTMVLKAFMVEKHHGHPIVYCRRGLDWYCFDQQKNHQSHVFQVDFAAISKEIKVRLLFYEKEKDDFTIEPAALHPE